jgi:hypothetical protein
VFGPFPQTARSATIPRCPKTTVARKRREMKREEIEQRFLDAGWDLDGSFEDYQLIGHNGERISLLAYTESIGRPIILSSRSSATKRCSPTGYTKYQPPSKPHNYSTSMPSLPRSGICPRRRLRPRRAQKSGGSPTHIDIGSGERVHHPPILLTRLDPGVQILFSSIGDVVHPTSRASSLRRLPLGVAESFFLHLPQVPIQRPRVYLLELKVRG